MRYQKTTQTTPRWFAWLLSIGLLATIALFAPILRERVLMPSLKPSPVIVVPSTAVPRIEQPRLRHMPLQAVEEVAPTADTSRDERQRSRQALQQATVEGAPDMGMPRDRPPRGAVGDSNGIVPNGTTVFNDELPGVANLDPALLAALRRAAVAAAADWVEFYVTSGWRSPEYQEQLLREAIAEYGSQEEAARWVATPETSPHVSGDAVDIGRYDAMEWLSEHGAKYGLCQIYINEPWHFELRPEAATQGCPPMYLDPTHDPRMQR